MSKRNPKISVIMSVFNEEKYIKHSLKSILHQTEQDFEIIIIDDCSTDATRSIIQKMAYNDSRIKPQLNECNMGLTYNLNQALALAKGEYIARMDGDDISSPRRFEVQIKYLEQHQSTMLVSCNTNSFGAINLISDVNGKPEYVKCAMLLRPQLAHPGFMMRGELYRNYGYRYDEQFTSAQDYDFAWRVSRRFEVAVVPEILLKYRVHNAQVSSVSGGKQLSFADSIRERALEELRIRLSEVEYSSYRKWAQEKKSEFSDFKTCKKIIGLIINRNIQRAPTIYDQEVLETVLWNNYFQWVLRTNGKQYIRELCCDDKKLYIKLVRTWFRLSISKIRRKGLGLLKRTW